MQRTFVANMATIEANGTYNFGSTSGFTSITAEWITDNVAPAGVFTFTVNGDPGNSGNSIDISTAQRCIVSNIKLPIVDMVVTGFPSGGACKLHFR